MQFSQLMTEATYTIIEIPQDKVPLAGSVPAAQAGGRNIVTLVLVLIVLAALAIGIADYLYACYRLADQIRSIGTDAAVPTGMHRFLIHDLKAALAIAEADRAASIDSGAPSVT